MSRASCEQPSCSLTQFRPGPMHIPWNSVPPKVSISAPRTLPHAQGTTMGSQGLPMPSPGPLHCEWHSQCHGQGQPRAPPGGHPGPTQCSSGHSQGPTKANPQHIQGPPQGTTRHIRMLFRKQFSEAKSSMVYHWSQTPLNCAGYTHRHVAVAHPHRHLFLCCEQKRHKTQGKTVYH